jgi:hypothetical protein
MRIMKNGIAETPYGKTGQKRRTPAMQGRRRVSKQHENGEGGVNDGGEEIKVMERQNSLLTSKVSHRADDQ